MKNKLLIVGASGHGKVLADIANKMDKWEKIQFLDDNDDIKVCVGFKVIDKVRNAFKYKDEADFIVAIGDNSIRKNLQENYVSNGLSLATLIHPRAVIGRNVFVDKGTAVMAGVVINSDTKIGKGCIVNTNSNIDHDCFIDDFTHISPGVNIAGTVKIGKKNWIGIGSIISNNVVINKECILGAGSVVVKNIMESGVYIGSPARKLDK